MHTGRPRVVWIFDTLDAAGLFETIDEGAHRLLGDARGPRERLDRATIERIGAREGWRTLHFWRGPGDAKLFELYEFWVENRVMLELVTEDMLAAYVTIANGPAQQRPLAARRAR